MSSDDGAQTTGYRCCVLFEISRAFKLRRSGVSIRRRPSARTKMFSSGQAMPGRERYDTARQCHPSSPLRLLVLGIPAVENFDTRQGQNPVPLVPVSMGAMAEHAQTTTLLCISTPRVGVLPFFLFCHFSQGIARVEGGIRGGVHPARVGEGGREEAGHARRGLSQGKSANPPQFVPSNMLHNQSKKFIPKPCFCL